MWLKSLRSPADPAQMLGTSLSSEAWIGTVLIAAITVLSCLGFICTRLRYDLEVIDVVARVKSLRTKIAGQLDQLDEEAPKQPSPAQRDQAMARSDTPTPDADASVDLDGPADSEEIAENQPDPEVVTPDSAEAA